MGSISMQEDKKLVRTELLRDFAAFILEQYLDNLADCYLDKVKEMDISLWKMFGDLPQDKLLTMSKKSLSEFLESLINGTANERLNQSLRNWEEDKLGEGLSKEDILPSDLVLISRAQSIALVKFVPRFTKDVEEAIAIIEELSAYFTKVQEQGFEVYQRLRQSDEAELSRSEERFRIVVDSVKEYAIFRLDSNGYIRTWNLGAQRLKGYNENEVLGKHFSIFYPEEDIENGKPEMELELAVKEGAYEEEGWRIRKDGTRFWANVVITPIFSSAGKHIGFVKVTRDQTDRMRFIQTLQQKNEELASYIEDIEQFAYISSHDLKEPLRMVASYTQLLQKHCHNDSDPTSTQYQGFISEGINRMYSLLNALIEYASIRREQEIREPVDLQNIIEETKLKLAEQIQATNAEIKYSQLPVVRSSPRLMQLLFGNIVENAIKFRKPDERPVIDIGCKRNDHTWTIWVNDNGIGIDPEYHENIFVIFKRLHPREQYPGTGMGLAIAKKIVELHGGWIWLESEPGVGSSFYFTLPAKENGKK